METDDVFARVGDVRVNRLVNVIVWSIPHNIEVLTVR